MWTLTFLLELEAVGDATLVANEQEAASLLSSVGSLLCGGDFWTELNSATNNALRLDRDCWGLGTLEIIPRVGLANMGGEWALELRVNLSCKFEVVVPSTPKISWCSRCQKDMQLTSEDLWQVQDRL